MSKFRNWCKCRRGFTLIEIIVVVALIGILTAVLIPSFDKAGERTKNNKLAADLRAVDTALGLYKLDKGTLPVALNDLRPDYLAEASEFKDAKNAALSYTPNAEKLTYTLSGAETGGKTIYSPASSIPANSN